MAGRHPRISWRQGHVLTADTAEKLGLAHPANPTETTVVVVSHDCDLVQSETSEPLVEVIIGREINEDEVNGNFLNAKGSRTLHLPFTAGSSRLILELSATQKRQIDKAALIPHNPSPIAQLSLSGRRILQRWLAARYLRAAFPDEFVARFGNSGADERLKKIVKKAQSHLVAIYFDLDRGEEKERAGDDDLYELSIFLVHPVDPDPAISREAAHEAKVLIEQMFETCCKHDGQWRGIQLEGCYVQSAAEVTLHTVDFLKKWNTDYLSFRADPEGPMVAV